MSDVKTCFKVGSIGFSICLPGQANCVKLRPVSCAENPLCCPSSSSSSSSVDPSGDPSGGIAILDVFQTMEIIDSI
jgi:hypothetical protein